MAIRWIVVGLLLLGALSTRAYASGWNDYELEIQPGWTIVRCSSIQFALAGPDGVPFSSDEFPGTGPFMDYATAPGHILIRAATTSPPGADVWKVDCDFDYSVHRYFVVNTTTNAVTGPLDEAAFQANPIVASSQPVAWTGVSNPNIVVPVVGSMLFLISVLVVVGTPIALLFAVGGGGAFFAWWLIRTLRRPPG